jgi:hypothetical protein
MLSKISLFIDFCYKFNKPSPEQKVKINASDAKYSTPGRALQESAGPKCRIIQAYSLIGCGLYLDILWIAFKHCNPTIARFHILQKDSESRSIRRIIAILRQFAVEIILPSVTRRPTQEKLRRARRLGIHFPVSEDACYRDMAIAAHDKRGHCSQDEFRRLAVFIIAVEGDCDTAAIDIPIARVPTNFRIRQEPLSVPIISDEPMVWPKDLLAVTFVPGEDGSSLQMPICLRRVGKIGTVKTHKLNRRESSGGEPRRIACMVNHYCVNRQSLRVGFSHPAPEREVSRRQMEFKEVVESLLARGLYGPGLVPDSRHEHPNLRNEDEVPRGFGKPWLPLSFQLL